jgi:enterochelin esterase-like enzyme
VKDIVPFVEKNYRVQAGRENRAIAGLSMGGGQTLRVVTTHPDEFAYVGVWSAGLFGGNAADWEKHNADFLASAGTVNHAVKLSRSASVTRTPCWLVRRAWRKC